MILHLGECGPDFIERARMRDQGGEALRMCGENSERLRRFTIRAPDGKQGKLFAPPDVKINRRSDFGWDAGKDHASAGSCDSKRLAHGFRFRGAIEDRIDAAFARVREYLVDGGGMKRRVGSQKLGEIAPRAVRLD